MVTFSLALDVKRVSPRSLSGSRDRPYQGDVGSLMDSSKPTLFSRLLMFVHQFDEPAGQPMSRPSY